MRRTVAVVGVLVVLGTAACAHRATFTERPADYVAIMPYPSDTMHKVDPDRAQLRGPQYTVRFVGTEVTDLAFDLSKPAPGYEFLVVYADSAQSTGPYSGATFDTPPLAEVRVDGKPHWSGDPRVTGWLISVPKGHDAVLAVTDEGRTQTMNLRAMTRGPDAVAGYYKASTVKGAGFDYRETASLAYQQARLTASANLDFTGATGSLEPYVPGLGWAKDGRIWLQFSHLTADASISVDNDNALDRLTLARALYITFSVDRNAAFTLAYPGGTAAPVPVKQDFFSGADAVLAFDVPDSFTAGTLTVHPPEQVDTHNAPGAVSWPKRFPARQYPVTVAA